MGLFGYKLVDINHGKLAFYEKITASVRPYRTCTRAYSYLTILVSFNHSIKKKTTNVEIVFATQWRAAHRLWV